MLKSDEKYELDKVSKTPLILIPGDKFRYNNNSVKCIKRKIPINLNKNIYKISKLTNIYNYNGLDDIEFYANYGWLESFYKCSKRYEKAL